MDKSNARLHPRDIIPTTLHGDGQFVLRRDNFMPAYLRAFEEGLLQRRVEEALESLRSCRVCPRDCQIDRLSDKIGVCKSGRYARVASAFPHFGEGDCLRGWNGSGTNYPAHKAAALPRFPSINRHLDASEFEKAVEAAEAAGLWRLDTVGDT
jgi:uncharacterized Fe-S radical SAM superfamily protein PflX